MLKGKEDRRSQREEELLEWVRQLREEVNLLKFEAFHISDRLPTDEEFAKLTEYAQKWYRKYAPDSFQVAADEAAFVCGLNGCTHRSGTKANAKRHRENCAKRQRVRQLDLLQNKQSTLPFNKRQRTN